MKSKHLWLFLSVLIIASFLRLYQITTITPGLYPDEAMNGNNALEALQTGEFKVFYPENNGREGLFINTQALFLKFFGVNEPWVLRLPSAIFGILTVLGVYFLAKELFGYEIRKGYEYTKKNDDSGSEIIQPLSYIRNKFVFRSEAVALLSAFFLATSFWHINFSHIGFRAIMAPLLLVWALYFLLKAIKSSNAKTQMPNQVQNSNDKQFGISDFVWLRQISRSERFDLKFRFWILPAMLGGILYGLGFYTYISYRVSPLLLLLLIPFFKKEKDFWKIMAIFLITTFFVALPIGIYYLHNPADFMGRTAQVSVFSSPSPLTDLAGNTAKTLGMFNFAGDWNWRHNYAGSPELFWPVGLLFILGIIIGIKSIVESLKLKVKNDSGFGFWILFLWFFLAMLPVVISNEGIPHALRSILMIPPVMILAGIGGIWLYDFLKKYMTNFWLPLCATAFLAILVFQGYYSYFIAWAKNPNVQEAFAADYVDIGRKINSLPADMPKYVVVQAGGTLVRGIPMPTQTVMFISNTFLPEGQKAKNVHYILPREEKNIPAGAEIFYIR